MARFDLERFCLLPACRGRMPSKFVLLWTRKVSRMRPGQSKARTSSSRSRRVRRCQVARNGCQARRCPTRRWTRLPVAKRRAKLRSAIRRRWLRSAKPSRRRWSHSARPSRKPNARSSREQQKRRNDSKQRLLLLPLRRRHSSSPSGRRRWRPLPRRNHSPLCRLLLAPSRSPSSGASRFPRELLQPRHRILKRRRRKLLRSGSASRTS
mmetsp:Transcript_43901/g.91912  ORF Transcript_43901/g.91912 Transcript_43901/m.91912 type:complete len:209 (+) Transcript_43901:979-1605(+)